jgi:hypothetical protein
VLFLLRVVLRKQWLAASVFIVLFTYDEFVSNTSISLASTIGNAVMFVLIYGILVLIMTRLGFFALMTTLFVINVATGLFLTTDFGAWYGQSSLMVVLVLCTFAFWGFRQSLAGRPVFGAPALDG